MMVGTSILVAFVILLFKFRDDNKYEIVYFGTESNLSEANEYYWLLKNNRIPLTYQIPYNWENFYRFGYKESPVYIKVSEKDVEKARKVMLYHRVEKMKMERNIAANKNHH
ncbi:hypothetical protein P5G51_001605 [Virgibacillus sp. 179-BFC.A HS]|uniref:DUF2007 domain-containing protein n=1 Tax=Tigheibacillus jepli TaxID=3035914 RepID=A0ABU5CD75_9BACI|nr:hypothetical protein [Virgibacillus sp. 179-BFC.A HS]MDY0404283.1 hypothetical protein [Virgibacillus sp. 179-BFC.A HS]